MCGEFDLLDKSAPKKMKVGTGRSTCNVGVDAKADDQTTLVVKIIRSVPDSDQ